MSSEKWKVVHSSKISSDKPIHEKEGWGVLWVLKHLTRSERSFGRRHLTLCDNLGLVLSLSKGRAQSDSMNRICRKIAALSLACNISLVVRWIASERNPADEPSRRFEKKQKSDPQKLQPSISEGVAPAGVPPFVAELDCVATTSTANAAAQSLLDAGAISCEVWCFARTPAPD